ncbi:Putative glucose-methanol-choline oxidoreductase, FAD/NAD(P)-binding domain superfamily [Septoria linicola]|uniref:Glucose-methanol-choline oxidoreductase, FAD/NAD(P)-binding domain superfamily n=1 Tax=Septoria linicola TaxID=215465 RepID=A0A9Q9AWP3_9PEZI|nr:Putative glucose-methanol-choline oxidoreductase, FAD/NAD(P)-binding domain superfamily [Septoria linicola]
MAGTLLTCSLLASTCLAQGFVAQKADRGSLTGTSFGIPSKNATYDYVIVGGGTAAHQCLRCKIEAGNFYELSNGNWSQIPYWSEQWVGAEEDDWQPLIDWGLFTEEQVNGKSIHYAQGKNLGGSTGRNQMMWHRPTVGSYAAWAEHVGDDSYTWDNMLKYMQRSVKYIENAANRPANTTPPTSPGAYSADGGPVIVSHAGYVHPLAQYGPAAFSSIGLKMINDFSGGHLDGYSYWPFSIDPATGLRSSAESSFLAESLSRPKLTTYINAHVNNILFSENGTAMGVNVTNYGMRPFTLTARKEVIVSAGAYHSPQLLMVSGIGPKDALQKFNIPVIKDAPGVGQNMWDSCNIGGPVFKINVTGYSTWQQPGYKEQADAQLLAKGSGPLTNTGLDMGAWEKLPAANRANLTPEALTALSVFPSDWPEIEWSLSSSGKTLTASDATVQYGTIGAVLVAATSRGNMTIRSASNLDTPIIDPNWLRDSTDQQVAIQAYRRAREAWNVIPLKVGDEVSLGKNVTSDADLLEAIKSRLGPIHHASSSCAMGKADNPYAVVDAKARVFGVHNLRVIDSSSFPFTPPGHTQGVTYSHAEKLVDDVIEAYRASM